MKAHTTSFILIILAMLFLRDVALSKRPHLTDTASAHIITIKSRQTIVQLRVSPKTRKQLNNLLQETKTHPTSQTIIFAGLDHVEKLAAAEAIALKINRPLLKINIKTVASKYIGETEKNIDSFFRKAKSRNAILFFDEADALFGKRTEVSDAHDRYANQEVSYLLKHMKKYPGSIIVSTQGISRIKQAPVFKNQSIITFPCKHPRDCPRN